MKLRVWAHWTDQQPPTPPLVALPSAPFPGSLTGYPLPPGGLPKNAGIPVWKPTPPGPTNLPVVAWCELAKQDDIKSAKWFGATWPGQPPPPFPGQTVPPPNLNADQGDEGYDSQAIGFRVTKVTLLLHPNVPNKDFVFTITAPGSLFTQTVLPPWTGSFSILVPIPFDGKGIWSILMDRAPSPPLLPPGSTVLAPALLGVPPLGPSNAVEEPYVIPYSGSNEGVLGLEFEGDEIICPTAMTSVTIGDCKKVETPPGSGNFILKRPVTLEVAFSSAPPVGALLNWVFGPSGNPSSKVFTVTTAGTTTFQEIVDYVADNNLKSPSVNLIVSQPTTICTPVLFTPFSLPSCRACPEKVEVDLVPPPGETIPKVKGCAPTNAAAWFKASVKWPIGTASPPSPTAYDWSITFTPPGGQPKSAAATTLTDTVGTAPVLPPGMGWTGNGATPAGAVDLTQDGKYDIAVSAKFSPFDGLPTKLNGTPDCHLTGGGQFIVLPCCPTRVANLSQEWQVIGNVTAPLSPNHFQTVDCDKSTVTMSLTVDRGKFQPGDLKYTWNFMDGTPVGPPISGPGGATQTHTFTNPTPGQTKTYTVEVTVDALGCAPLKVPIMLTVPGCVQPPDTKPPEVTGPCSVSAGSPGTITVTFSEDVDQAAATIPGNFAVTVNGMPRVPTSLTYVPNTTTINGITINPGDAVSVTVSNVADKAGNVIAGKNTTNCSAPIVTPTPTPTPSCTIWCILAGIFFIAIPISAYISTAAHCLLGPTWNIALQGGIIAIAIGIFIALCGICCLWIFLLIGSALGVVATLIAAYWLGFPACWFVALPILIGFVALGIGMAASCGWRIR